MVNTEKPTGKAEAKKLGIVETGKKQIQQKTPLKKEEKVEIKKPGEEKKVKEEKKKAEAKKETPKIKKSEAVVNVSSLPISSKDSIAVCKFIKNKKIEKAIFDLGEVLLHKKAVPMKGEIPHRKGKGMASGRFLDKTVTHFIKLLKSLQANANANDLDEPIIIEAIANFAARPYGKFGRVQKKRTHVKIKAIKKKSIKKSGGKNGRKKSSKIQKR